MIGNWFNWLSPPKETETYTPVMAITPYAVFKEQTLEPQQALRNPTVFACVNVLAETVSQMPWSVIDEKKEGYAPVDHPLNAVLRKPNSAMTRVEFKKKLVTDLMMYGNVYLLKVTTTNGRVTELIPLDPPTITCTKSMSGSRKFKHMGGREYNENEIIHIRDFISLDVTGLSRIAQAAELIVQANTLDSNLTRSTRESSNLSGVITIQDKIEPAQAASFTSEWQKKHGGQITILSGGAQYHPLTKSSPADSETQALTKLEIARIASIFRVPSAFLELYDGSKYSNLSQKNSSFYRDSISPLTKNIATKLSAALLADSSGFAIEFDATELTKGDLSASAKIATDSYNAGILTKNEARNLCGYSDVEGGDTFVDKPAAPEPTSHNDYDAESTGEYGPRTPEGYSNE